MSIITTPFGASYFIYNKQEKPMPDPVAVDNELEKRIQEKTGLPAFDLLTFLSALIASCFKTDPPTPAGVVQRVKAMSLGQKLKGINMRTVDLVDGGMNHRDAKKQAKLEFQALNEIAKESTPDEHLAIAERAIFVGSPVVDLF